ncbi:MAG: hypothetical protein KKE50_03105 [Nanoarchaeota archaeon]|nr:hypothetical protein [Nanoarchaeota archaeon]
MEIRKYWCDNCKMEHVVKTYKNKSEALADIFMENDFPVIWNHLKEKQKELPIEEFCKEIVEASVYNFHRYIKKLKVPNGSVKHENTGGITNE